MAYAAALAWLSAGRAPAAPVDPLWSTREFGSVQAAALSADGRLLAVSGADGRLRVADAESGKSLRVLAPAAAAGCLRFDRAAPLLAAGRHGEIQVWNASTGERVRVVPCGASRVAALDFSPAGKRLLAGCADGVVRVFDTADYSEVARLPVPGSAAVSALCLAPQGSLAVCAAGSRLLVWDILAPAAPPRVLDGHRAAVSALAFAAGGAAVSAGGDKSLRFWDIVQPAEKQLRDDHRTRVAALAAGDGGRLLASAAAGDEPIVLRRGENGEPLHELAGPRGGVTALCLSADGRLLVVASRGLGPTLAAWRIEPQALYAGGGSTERRDRVEAGYLSPAECAVIEEMNLARACPSRYAEFARSLRARFEGKVLVDGNARIATREGAAAVDEAIAFLSKARPVPALAPSRGLSRAARDHARDIGPRGAIGHEGADGSTSENRISRYGRWVRTCGENISFGVADARSIVLQLIVDDGVPGRGHRDNIFNADFRVAGVAIDAHRAYRTLCVIDYAGGYEEKNE